MDEGLIDLGSLGLGLLLGILGVPAIVVALTLVRRKRLARGTANDET